MAQAADDDDGRDVGFIVLTSAGRGWTFRVLHHFASEEIKQELAWAGLYSTRGTRAQGSSRFAGEGGEVRCFGCGWALPGGEKGDTDGAWERHRAAVGRACRYALARPSTQPLAQYAQQRDTLALQQLLLSLGKQLQAAEHAQDEAALEKIKKKVQFVVMINKEHIESVPELKQGFGVLAKHLVGPACPRSHSSPSVSVSSSSSWPSPSSPPPPSPLSPSSSATPPVAPSPSSPSSPPLVPWPGLSSNATQSYLSAEDCVYSPSSSAETSSSSSSSTSSSSSSPSQFHSSSATTPPTSNPSSWSSSSIPVTSSDFYSVHEDSTDSFTTRHPWNSDEDVQMLKKQLMEYTCDTTETETETTETLESDTDTSTDSGTDDSFAGESGDGDDALLRRGRPWYKEVDFHELTFLEKIGSGAFGTVWRGEWRGGQVAIKILHDSDVFNRRVLNEFRREAETMHVVGNHPNVVKFIGVCTRQGHSCIVSEFCTKGSLEQLIRGKQRPLPLPTTVRMARDAAAGILHLHCESVIHRDIAARNVMIGENYSVHVGDFGFARVKDKNASCAFTSTIGPAKYMAPEAIKEKKYSEKSDSFSFGVLLWEMITGKEPWEDQKSLVEIAIGVSSRGWRLPIPADCPEPLADMMNRCWANDPKERPDFRAIHRTLNNFLLSLPSPEPLSP